MGTAGAARVVFVTGSGASTACASRAMAPPGAPCCDPDFQRRIPVVLSDGSYTAAAAADPAPSVILRQRIVWTARGEDERHAWEDWNTRSAFRSV
jgi:hypothetical protein